MTFPPCKKCNGTGHGPASGATLRALRIEAGVSVTAGRDNSAATAQYLRTGSAATRPTAAPRPVMKLRRVSM